VVFTLILFQTQIVLIFHGNKEFKKKERKERLSEKVREDRE
jgi:predicted membrane protein